MFAIILQGLKLSCTSVSVSTTQKLGTVAGQRQRINKLDTAIGQLCIRQRCEIFFYDMIAPDKARF